MLATKITHLVCLFALISVFAVGIDFFHDNIELGKIEYSLWVVLEDGGELFVTSAIVAFVARSIFQELSETPANYPASNEEKHEVSQRRDLDA